MPRERSKCLAKGLNISVVVSVARRGKIPSTRVSGSVAQEAAGSSNNSVMPRRAAC